MAVETRPGTPVPPEVTVPFPRVPGLTVRHYQSGPWSVVEASGELDIQVVPLMRHHLRGEPSHLVFDLSRVTFMDASGLGILASSLRLAAQVHGCVRVVGPSRQVRKMLAITHLDQAMSIYASVQEALTASAVHGPGTGS